MKFEKKTGILFNGQKWPNSSCQDGSFFPQIRAHNGEIDETTPPKTPKLYCVLVSFAEKLQSV